MQAKPGKKESDDTVLHAWTMLMHAIQWPPLIIMIISGGRHKSGAIGQEGVGLIIVGYLPAFPMTGHPFNQKGVPGVVNLLPIGQVDPHNVPIFVKPLLVA